MTRSAATSQRQALHSVATMPIGRLGYFDEKWNPAMGD